ncbi:MAG: DUF4129 domain-containing protein [Gemmatimonadaceae bacterium]
MVAVPRLLQVPDTLHWPVAAVRDTVAAIAREAAYRRAVTTSLFDRLLEWLGSLWGRMLAPLRDSAQLRTLVITAAALLVITVVARLVVAARATASGDGRARGAGPAASVGDPWIDAEHLAAAGEFTAAAHALYGALLGRLAGRGAVRVHPSKTAGDYARELRRAGLPEQAPFQQFRMRYDRVIYGKGTCTPDEYAALLSDVQSLLGRAA